MAKRDGEDQDGAELRDVKAGTLSLKLPDPVAKVVRALAADDDITFTEVLRRGVQLERFISEQTKAGGTFYLQRVDGLMERVHFVF